MYLGHSKDIMNDTNDIRTWKNYENNHGLIQLGFTINGSQSGTKKRHIRNALSCIDGRRGNLIKFGRCKMVEYYLYLLCKLQNVGPGQ